MTNIVLKSKLARAFALIPVGIGSVIGTVYLTNFSRPFELLDSLNFVNRPELEETLISPVIPMPSGGGGSAGTKSAAESGGESDSKTSESSSEESENQEGGEAKQSESSKEEAQSSAMEIDGIEPEQILKQVINNITTYNWNKKLGIETIDWLLKNLKEGRLAMLKIKVEMLKKQIEAKNTDSGSTNKAS